MGERTFAAVSNDLLTDYRKGILMRLIVLTVIAALATGPAFPQYIDPQAGLDALILQQLEKNAREEAARRQLEGLREWYARLSVYDLEAELERYCPNGSPPCLYAPPSALLREAASRGLIQFSSLPRTSSPGTDCIFLGDGLGGGIADCQ